MFDGDGWLTDTDIDNVLKQYDNKCGFIYGGTYILEKQVSDIIQHFKKNWKKCKTIGYILWYKYHWCAFFVNIKQNELLYMDSEAIYEPKYRYVTKLCMGIKKILSPQRPQRLSLTYNKYDFQLDTYNCGIYAIDFIINCISNKDYESWIKEVPRNLDKLRNKFFI